MRQGVSRGNQKIRTVTVWWRPSLKDVVQERKKREERGTGRCQGVKSLRVLLSSTIERRWRDLETVVMERGKDLLSCDWRAIRRDGSAPLRAWLVED